MAAKEAREENLDIHNTLRKIRAAFLSSREISSQECVDRCLSELWLRRTFPGTVFITTALPSERVKMRKTDKELSELDDDSTDIFHFNITDRYSHRPDAQIDNDKCVPVDIMCLVEFAAYYYKPYKCNSDEENDNQPDILPHEVLESHISDLPFIP